MYRRSYKAWGAGYLSMRGWEWRSGMRLFPDEMFADLFCLHRLPAGRAAHHLQERTDRSTSAPAKKGSLSLALPLPSRPRMEADYTATRPRVERKSHT